MRDFQNVFDAALSGVDSTIVEVMGIRAQFTSGAQRGGEVHGVFDDPESLKGIRQAAALRFRLLTGGGFNPDEWREAPRLINRLDAAPVVLYRGQPVAVPAVPDRKSVV